MEDTLGEFGELGDGEKSFVGDKSLSGKDGGDLEDRLKVLEKSVKGFERGLGQVKGSVKAFESRGTFCPPLNGLCS
jgi:hypothetical protein